MHTMVDSVEGGAVRKADRSAARARFGPGDLRRTMHALPVHRAQRLIRAACGLTGQIEALARSGRSVMHELLGMHSVAEPWLQYPAQMVQDARTDSAFFFHSHGPSRSHTGERGHFHVFVSESPAHRSHLLAIAIDAYGMPIRLFTTNRWVTGESWTSAGALGARADRLSADQFSADRPCVAAADSNAVLKSWVACCVQLFEPQLQWLLHRRDARLRLLAAGRELERVFVDRRIEILSECRISVREQIAVLQAAPVALKHDARKY